MDLRAKCNKQEPRWWKKGIATSLPGYFWFAKVCPATSTRRNSATYIHWESSGLPFTCPQCSEYIWKTPGNTKHSGRSIIKCLQSWTGTNGDHFERLNVATELKEVSGSRRKVKQVLRSFEVYFSLPRTSKSHWKLETRTFSGILRVSRSRPDPVSHTTIDNPSSCPMIQHIASRDSPAVSTNINDPFSFCPQV